MIEAVESFIDYDTGMEAKLKFWLPRIFPDRIRFIVTCDKKSDNLTYLKNIGCDLMYLKGDRSALHSMLENLKSRPTLCDEDHKQKCVELIERKLDSNQIENALYLKSFTGCFMPYESPRAEVHVDLPNDLLARIVRDVDYERLEEINTLSGLIDYTLEYYETRIMKKKNFEKLFIVQVNSFKGLNFEEINRIVKFDNYEWELTLAIFKSFFFTFQGLWKISNDLFKAAIEKRYITDRPDLVIECHKDVFLSLESTPHSIRKFEEQTNQLYRARDYFTLKQTLSSIETFLLMFNSFTKYDQCRYWQVLEEHGYDPVVEYNKGQELFDMHFSPKAEDLFMIILQVSRFLKEFSDFETKFTPEFRHPFVKGKCIQLNTPETKVNQESEQATESVKKNKSLFAMFADKRGSQDQGKSGEILNKYLEPFADDDVEVSDVDDEFDKTRITAPNKINYLDDIGLLKELMKMLMTESKNTSMLNGHEKLNVDVQSGRTKFQKHFKEIINNKKIKKNFNIDPNENMKADFDIEEEEKENIQIGKMEIMQVETSKGIMKESPQYMIDQIDLCIEPERPVSFYYYKRWLWMIFPWACMSVDSIQTFSDLINKCYSSNIRYLSVEEEALFTKQAINIVIQAKLNKASVMSSKKEEEQTVCPHSAPIGGGKARGVKLPPMQNPTKRIMKKGSESSFSTGNKPLGRMKNSNSVILHGPNLNDSILAGENNRSMNGSQVQKNTNQATFFTQPVGSRVSSGKIINDQKKTASTKVSQIQAKSKFWEDRLDFQGYHDEVKNLQKQNQGTNPSELNELRDTQMKYTDKEIHLLEMKNNDLIREFNNQTNDNRQGRKLQDSLDKITHDLIGPDPNIEIKMQGELFELKDNLDNKLTQLDKSFTQQKRMVRILDICEINRVQNEEWIRGLNFYQTNLRKMIKFENYEIKQIDKDITTYGIISENFIKNYNKGIIMHDHTIKSIENSLSNQKNIDYQIRQTDNLIYQSVELRKERNAQTEKIKKENVANERVSLSSQKILIKLEFIITRKEETTGVC